MLVQIIYCSLADQVVSEADLARLMAQSQKNNRRIGISGALIYREPYFVQCIEGPAAATIALMKKIARDPRHREVLEIERRVIPARHFEQWDMNWKYSAGSTDDDQTEVPEATFFQTLARAARLHEPDMPRSPARIMLNFLSHYSPIPLGV